LLASARPLAQDSAALLQEPYVVPEAVPRFALAVGVQYYDYLEQVPNAINDVNVAIRALQAAGFTTIIQEPEPTQEKLRAAVKTLTQLVNDTERPAVVAIYFAGHGFQEGDSNFIVPKDAKPTSLLEDSISVANIVVKLAPRRAGLAILFLDACRTLTPLAAPGVTHAQPIPSRPGFGQVATFNGAVLSFAPGFNEAALSRAHNDDTNSPYAQSLERNLTDARASLADLLAEIYAFVTVKTDDRQHPANLAQASLTTVRFMPLVEDAELRAEEGHWRATLATNRSDCVMRYKIQYPHSRYTMAALRWLAEAPTGSSINLGGDGCPKR
jgi:uncharacterized caspase-like protein